MVARQGSDVRWNAALPGRLRWIATLHLVPGLCPSLTIINGIIVDHPLRRTAMRPLVCLILGLSVLCSLSACGTSPIAIEPPPQSTLYQRGTNPIIDQQITEVEQNVSEQRQASQKTYYLIPSGTDLMSQYTLIGKLKSYYRERSD